MVEAKTAIKKGRASPGDDVLPRYLQGSMYTTREERNKRRSSGGSKKLGKKKLSKSLATVKTDKKGYTVGGWSDTLEGVT